MRLEEAIKKARIDGGLDVAQLSAEELERMAEAGQEVVEIHRLLAKTSNNIVGELIKHHDTFYEWDHYPPGDVYDRETHAQFYYHAHAAADRFEGEHGHFHTFLRPKGMPEGIAPADIPGAQMPEDKNDWLSHLIAIAMDNKGLPFRLFTVNRWVTGEVWYDAEDVIRMLDCFVIDHTQPSWPVNRWISGMMQLYRPQIAELIRARDRFMADYQAEHEGEDIYEDRNLEVTSFMDIDLDQQLNAVLQAQAV